MKETIKKLCKNKIKLCVISEDATAQHSNEKMIQVRRKDSSIASFMFRISLIPF